ncbi:MAG: sulfotransferase [Parvularculaceae bacterium]
MKSDVRESSAQTVGEALRQGFEALQQGRPKEAAALCKKALALDPARPEAHFLVGLVAQDTGDMQNAVRAFASVAKIDPNHAAAWAHLARAFIRLGQPARAESAISKACALDPSDAPVADLVGVVLSMLGDQREAKKWYERACRAAPESEAFAVNLATASMFLGRNEEAKERLAPFIGRPHSGAQGEWLYSSIERAKDSARAETLLARARTSEPGPAAFLAYAAGKEFEDCGAWPSAFEAFKIGAQAKRSITGFDEGAEEKRFAALKTVFSQSFADDFSKGCDDPAPIFVVGQPRTGTTLIERIITSHSQVESAGELQQFRLSVSRLSQTGGGAADPNEAIGKWAAVDPKALGEEYLRVSAPMRTGAPHFVDKLPGNYLYIPLILAALPNARIVHLTRNPMDACFASYKQLFAEAYLHSYDQGEMARHFARYWALMNEWRRRFPGRFLDVSYEETVSDLEPNARRLIDFLGLPWEDACLRFYEQEGPVATASAVQVREKPHTRSIGRWRRYAQELEPMRTELIRCGVPADAP